jgi:hypothetical protein
MVAVRLAVLFTVLFAVPASPVAAQAPAASSDGADAVVADSTGSADGAASAGTDLWGAMGDSIKLLVTEHAIRLAFQEKTRRELAGPFWSDYRRSIRWPTQWEDSDSWLVNYIGHPIHGGAAGIIWLDHGPDPEEPISLRRRYWGSRARAAAFSAIYSLQFEIGPLSEASIGNVGLRPETTGWVDHVVTPVGAFGLMVAGDALDRYLVTWVERRVGNRIARAILRMAFNPSRTLANLAQNHEPWRRAGRRIGWR